MKILIIIVLILTALITKPVYGQSNITYEPGTSIEIQVNADVCADAIIINGTYSGGGTICTGPLPVELLSFTYSVSKRNVSLSWETAFEINNSGFDLERKTVTLSGAEGWEKAGFIQGSGTTNEPKQYIYEDKKLKAGTYKYRLKQIDYNGSYEYFDLLSDVKIEPPRNYSIGQNYPNPSNPKSKIEYEIPISSKVSIKLYNLLGQEVITLVNEIKEAGYYTVEFDGTNIASGVYFYRITAGSYIAAKKLTIIK